MSKMREMHADLMGAACFWFSFNHGERTFANAEAVQDTKGRESRRPIGMDGLFQPDPGGLHDSLSQ